MPDATKPTLPANPDKEDRGPFSFARHRNSLLLIGGCVLLLIVARSCNLRQEQTAKAQKELRQRDSGQRDQTDEQEQLRLLRKQLLDAQKREEQKLEADKAEQQAAVTPALTPAQQERMGAMAANGGAAAPGDQNARRDASGVVRQQGVNSLASTPATPAVPASLIISYRSEAAATEPKPAEQTAAPAVSAAAPPPGPAATAPTGNPEDQQHDLAASTGDKYRIRQGTWLPCTEELRINGALASGIDCLISIPVYSTSGAHLLIPQGTVALGKVQRVGNVNQERLLVAFDTFIMPDGYTVTVRDADGLDQIGQTGLRDKVNHHYLQIFGVSIAIAGISGLSQIGNYGTAAITPGAQYRAGVTQNMSESSMQVLDRFLNVLPTFIIREGARNNIHLPWNLWLPDYAKHSMKENL